MERNLCERILAAPGLDPGPGWTPVSQQKRRAYLTAVHAILSTRNRQSGASEDEAADSHALGIEKDVGGWGSCLNTISADTILEYPDITEHTMKILAYLNQRSMSGVITEDSPLILFLQRPEIVSNVNEHLRNSKRCLYYNNDWMAIATLARINGLLSSTLKIIINCAIGSTGFAGLLDMTGRVWDIGLDVSIRQKMENIMFVLNALIAGQPSEVLQLLGQLNCRGTLLQISARLEQGCVALSTTQDTDQMSNDGYYSESDDEEDILGTGKKDKKKGKKNKKKDEVEPDVVVLPDIDDIQTEEERVNIRFKMLLQQRESEKALPRSRTSWVEICLTAVTEMYIRITKADLGLVTRSVTSANSRAERVATRGHDLSLSDTMLMMNAPSWQRKLLSLVILKDLLKHPMRSQAQEGVPFKSQGPPEIVKKQNADKPDLNLSNKKLSTKDNLSAPASTGGSIKDRRGSQRRSSTKPLRPVEELCKSGYMRQLCCNLLNCRGLIRKAAAELVVLIVQSSQRQEVGVDIWASFVEQGLVPLLEMIHAGTVVEKISGLENAIIAFDSSSPENDINQKIGEENELLSREVQDSPVLNVADDPSTKIIFPELSTRQSAGLLLRQLSTHLENSSILRLRLASALLHSGNQALRHNIFSGLLYMAARPEEPLESASDSFSVASVKDSFSFVPSGQSKLGWSLWGMSTPSQDEAGTKGSKKGGAITNTNVPTTVAPLEEESTDDQCQGRLFKDMLRSLSRDPSELKSTISIIAYTLRLAVQVREAKIVTKVQFTDKNIKQTISGRGGVNSAGKLEGGATVLVRNEGQLVKMLCPAPSVINTHSPDLKAFLDAIPDDEGIKPFADETLGIGVDKRERLRNSDKDNKSALPILAGSYTMWQEIFSHMLDNFLLDSSLSKMPCDEIIEAFQIARKFRMYSLLDKYADAIGRRLNGDTIVSALECALGRDADSLHDAPSGSARNTQNEAEVTHLPDPAPSKDTANSVSTTIPPSPSTKMNPKVGTLHSAVGRRIHLKLSSRCFNYIEKQTENLFSTRSPLRQQELIALTHDVIAVMLYE